MTSREGTKKRKKQRWGEAAGRGSVLRNAADSAAGRGSPGFKRPLVLGCLAGILLLFFCVNARTFILSHANGDEVFYVANALKLDRLGIGHYNLRGIGAPLVNKVWREYRLMADPAAEGDLLRDLKAGGITYYDVPLFTTPPLLPAMIALGHRLFRPNEEAYHALFRRIRFSSLDFEKMSYIAKAQGYAAMWPLLFGLLFITATFFLGRVLFSDPVALCGALLVSVAPVTMLCSSKIWADTLVASLSCFSLWCYFLSVREKKIWLACLSGVLLGFAGWAKFSAFFVFFAVGIYHLWSSRERLKSLRGVIETVADARIWIFAVSFLVTLGPWLALVHKTYGNPMYQMHHVRRGNAGTDNWSTFLKSRPRFFYYVNYPYQTPIFGLFCLSPFLGRQLRDPRLQGRSLLFCVFLFTAWRVWKGGEMRYFLNALPSIALLSAAVFEDLRGRINRWSGMRLGDGMAVAALILCCWWSLRLGSRIVMSGAGVLAVPY